MTATKPFMSFNEFRNRVGRNPTSITWVTNAKGQQHAVLNGTMYRQTKKGFRQV